MPAWNGSKNNKSGRTKKCADDLHTKFDAGYFTSRSSPRPIGFLPSVNLEKNLKGRHDMGVQAIKSAIDLGIVTTNGPAMLAFYRDVLGFRHEGDLELNILGIKMMHRLWFGDSLIKLVVPMEKPNAAPVKGGIPGTTGYRYWTMTISNLDEVLKDVEAAGHKIIQPRVEIRPGVSVAFVEDPDGNWVEFVER